MITIYRKGTAITANANRFNENVTDYDRNENTAKLRRYEQTGEHVRETTKSWLPQAEQ